MPEYFAPGVYVEEQSTTQPIEGVSTSVTGFIGLTQRGPDSGPPVLVTSFPEYSRTFGSYFDFGVGFEGLNGLPHAVQGFFVNGGELLYVRRVKGIGALAAKKLATGGLITRLSAEVSPAALSQARLLTLRGIQNGVKLTFTQVKNGLTTVSGPHTVKSYNRDTNEVTLTTPLSGVFEARYTTVASDLLQKPSIEIDASNPGSWGNGLDIQATHSTAAKAEVLAILGPLPSGQVQLRTTAGFYVGAWVEFDRGQDKSYGKVTAINGQVITIQGTPFALATDLSKQGAAPYTLASVCEFNLTVSYDGVTERFSRLTLEPVPGHFIKEVVSASSLITVPIVPANTDPSLFPSGDDGLHIKLGGGVDGSAPGDPEYIGIDNGPNQRSGIQALQDIDNISIVAVPGIGSQLVQQSLIDQCESLKYRVALLDPKPKSANQAPDLTDIQNQRSLYDSKYAALYYPRVKVYDPLSRSEIAAPPSGFIAGICARVDENRGVFKPPANEILNGVLDLEVIVNQREQQVLNPEPVNINVLRDFRSHGRGLRVWGARCITSDQSFKYLNVRRLFIFLEASLDRGTQYAVFEPNDERLWARIRQSITNFLTRVWRDGGLMGTKAEEAFFVKCDRTTMTQDDIDKGRLIILVGVAPVKPAEFVIIRIGQRAGDTGVQEL
jgi:phage tail sheath protein FI